MRRSALFRDWALLLPLLLLPLAASPQPGGLVREGDHFVREFRGDMAAGRRLRINAHGPVSVQAGAGKNISYTVRVSVRARTEAEARIVMQRYNVRLTPQGEWVVLTAPGMELDWVVTTGPHRVVPLVGVPTAERLATAIDEAMATVGA